PWSLLSPGPPETRSPSLPATIESSPVPPYSFSAVVSQAVASITSSPPPVSAGHLQLEQVGVDELGSDRAVGLEVAPFGRDVHLLPDLAIEVAHRVIDATCHIDLELEAERLEGFVDREVLGAKATGELDRGVVGERSGLV